MERGGISLINLAGWFMQNRQAYNVYLDCIQKIKQNPSEYALFLWTLCSKMKETYLLLKDSGKESLVSY